MSFGVDVVGALTEKLKAQTNDTDNLTELFREVTQLYKDDKINKSEFVSKFLSYLVSFSATNFLISRVLLELNSAIAKGSSMKDATGGMASVSSVPKSSFGISGFVDTGGLINAGSRREDEYTLPQPR